MERYYFEKKDRDEKMFVLIYDISDNRRRYKVSKLMESYGKRVQESTFECCLPTNKYVKLKSIISKNIAPDDSIRIYPVNDLANVITWNGELMFERADVLIC